MRKVAKLALIGVGPELEARIMDATRRVAEVSQSIPDVTRFEELLDEPNQLIVVMAQPDVEDALKAVRVLSGKDAVRPIVLVSAVADPELVLKSMRAGARDYAVVDPELKEVGRSLVTLASERLGAAQGTVVSIYGAKGGCGATTIAVNLASKLRTQRDLKVMLVDVDLELGNAALFYDLVCNYSISEAVKNLDRLDPELLAGTVTNYVPTGVHVLAQSDNVEDASEVTPEGITALSEFLRKHYDAVILDGVRGFDNRALNALDVSDHILLVLTQDIPAIKNARRCLDIFDRLGYHQDRVHVVLNRFIKGHDIDPLVVGDALGRPVSATVSNDFPTVVGSINRGMVLEACAPKAGVTEDVGELVKLVAGAGPAQDEPKKGLFGGLFAKKRS